MYSKFVKAFICLPFWIQSHLLDILIKWKKNWLSQEFSFSHKWTNASLIRFSKLKIFFFLSIRKYTDTVFILTERALVFFFSNKKNHWIFHFFFPLISFVLAIMQLSDLWSIHFIWRIEPYFSCWYLYGCCLL